MSGSLGSMTTGTALVTGATGFIGTRLVTSLLAEGWEVRATGRRPRPDDMVAEAEYRPADLVGDEPGALADLTDGVSHLFHLAGASSSKSSQEEMDRDNGVATRRLLDASGHVERVVYMSSTSVYGEEVQLPSPVTEDVEPSPSRGYGQAKWGAEQVVREHGRAGHDIVVLRPVTVYGPGAIKLLASAMLDVAIEHFAGLPRVAVAAEPTEQRLVHIDDLIAACMHVATSDTTAGRTFNVVDGIYPTSHEVVALLAHEFGMEVEIGGDDLDGDRRRLAWETMVGKGMKPEILLSPERFRLMRKTNRNNRLSTEALEGTGFRFRHTDFPAAVTANVEWYRDHRWLI